MIGGLVPGKTKTRRSPSPCLARRQTARENIALNVLQAEREAQREDAFCDARCPHRHPVAKLLYGIELPAAVAEIGKLELAGRTFGMPPRLIEISAALQKDSQCSRKGLTKERVQIQLYCELSEKLVPGAVDVVEVDKDWVGEAQEMGALGCGKAVQRFTRASPTGDLDDFGGLPKDEDRKVDAAGKQLLEACRKAA